MTDYFKHTKPEHLQIAEAVWKQIAEFTESKRNGGKKRFKAISNEHKITVTRTGIYTNSYEKQFSAQVDKICRMRAELISDVLLDDLIPSASKRLTSRFDKNHINIHMCKVYTNTATMRGIFSVMKNRKMTIPTCECCGMQSKYVYVEKNIAPLPKKGVKVSFILAFYGVGEDGIEYRMTIDHIDPKSNGGEDAVANMQIMCRRCNALKASIPNEIFMEHREAINTMIAETHKVTQ